MKLKPIHVIGILATVIVLCIVGWVALNKQEIDPVITSKSTFPKKNDAETTKHSEESTRASVQEKAQRTQESFKELHQEFGIESHPTAQAIINGMDSPEYLEYLSSGRETGLYSHKLWNKFLLSQGLETYDHLAEEMFRKYYPTGELVDYKPMMEKRLAELYLAAKPIDETDEKGAQKQIVEGLEQFMEQHEANLLWLMASFQFEIVDKVQWATTVYQNAVSLAGVFTPAVTDTPTLPTDPAFTTESSTIDVAEETIDIPHLDTRMEVGSAVEDTETFTRTDKEIETEIMKSLGDIPELSTNKALETTLSERFSPKRLNTALQTLNQYGLKEGLRRIKESDLEISAHVERFIKRKEADD